MPNMHLWWQYQMIKLAGRPRTEQLPAPLAATSTTWLDQSKSARSFIWPSCSTELIGQQTLRGQSASLRWTIRNGLTRPTRPEVSMTVFHRAALFVVGPGHAVRLDDEVALAADHVVPDLARGSPTARRSSGPTCPSCRYRPKPCFGHRLGAINFNI